MAGFSGEQFALTEAIGALREVRRNAKSGETLNLPASSLPAHASLPSPAIACYIATAFPSPCKPAAKSCSSNPWIQMQSGTRELHDYAVVSRRTCVRIWGAVKAARNSKTKKAARTAAFAFLHCRLFDGQSLRVRHNVHGILSRQA